MRRIALSATLLALAACSSSEPPPPTEAVTAPAPAPAEVAAPEAPDAPQLPAGKHDFEASISAGDYAAHVQTLASDEFEGRSPGSIGERATTTYLQEQFQRIGLKPGNGESYFQTVPMVETRIKPNAVMNIDVAGKPLEFAMPKDMVVGTRSGEAKTSLNASELVFVGYGVNAPEYQWNDYAGLDVKGKTVVVLINDPGFIRKDATLFKGPTMTYYGRWTYKFEEAARQGAAGCLIVHETEAAAYGWDVVQNGWTGAQFDLPASEDAEPRLKVQGWLTGEAAKALFAAAGQDFEAQRQAADQRGFKPVALGGKVSVTVESSIRQTTSDNVIGILPGTEHADEAVLYMGHWDHLGRTFAAPDNDKIFNGAIDNASGVAGVLEIAEAFARSADKPKRSIVFLLPTLEESGLLGSRYYVNHPSIPLDKTLAVINMDAMVIHGRTRDMAIIGPGQSTLEETLAEVIRAQNRVTVPEESPERGYYFRSDHFNFARRGVPALYAKSGVDMIDGGKDAGMKDANDYLTVRYHKTSDEFNPMWDLSGVIEDLTALYEVGRRVSDGSARPAWKEDSEFRVAGEKLYGKAK